MGEPFQGGYRPLPQRLLQQLDTTQREYELVVDRLLRQIYASRTGVTVLRQIGKQNRRIVITRFPPERNKDQLALAAHSYPIALPTSDAGAAPKGLRFEAQSTAPGVPGESILGTGEGSSAIIYFDPRAAAIPVSLRPELWRWWGRGQLGLPGIGGKQNEMLFHELVHALRIVCGRWNPTSVSGAYHNLEEFFAILVTNIYMAECGATLLRRDHRTQDPLEDRLSSSKRFLIDHENLRLVKDCWANEPALCIELAQVVTLTNFNPLQEYSNNRKKYDVR